MTVLSSKSFHKSTTLALKNFCPNASFVFLHNFYLFCQVTLSGANSKNLSHCIDCFPVIILSRLHLSLLRSSFSPVLFVHTVSSFFIALILVAANNIFSSSLHFSSFPCPVSGMYSSLNAVLQL